MQLNGIYYEKRAGKGRQLVLIHGLAGSTKSFDKLKLTNKMMLIDLRGHGKSSQPHDKKAYEMEQVIDDVRQIIKKEKLKDFTFIGFSLGGYVALRLLDEFPGAEAIMINPMMTRRNVRVSFVLKALISLFVPRRLIRRVVKQGYHGLINAYGKMLLNTPRHVYWALLKNFKGISDIKTKKKFTLIKSDHDEILNYEMLGNYELINIRGHHYVMAENPLDLLKILVKRIR
ncbi:MAG: alpha/beta hydrolase [Candidatus Nanoarchaeia archaeon]